MGKATGFMEYARAENHTLAPSERIKSTKEFHSHLSEDERRRQAARCMDCGVPFCQSGMEVEGRTYGCPLNNLIPEWNDSLYEGHWDAALSRLLKTNNFPEFTGRVCPALCERACTCGIYSEPITIRENELSIIEKGFRSGSICPAPPSVRSGKRIAVVGSGPAGLAAADSLNRRGHHVTIFEKERHPGGLLTYGIPEMKLPKEIVLRRVRLMEEEGVQFRTGCEVGRDVQAEEISAEFDCVILCCGASQPRELRIDGDGGAGVVYAGDYLHTAAQVQLGELANIPDARGKRVIIVGAGDTATDCVATAIRQGCQDVIQLIRRPKADYEVETSLFPSRRGAVYQTDYAQEEAIAHFAHDPRVYERIVSACERDENGALCAVRIVPAKGGNEERIEAELLILATGFSGCDASILDAFGGVRDASGNARANGFRLDSGRAFVAGDMRRGQSLVVWAIAEGQRAAKEVDALLMGYSNM